MSMDLTVRMQNLLVRPYILDALTRYADDNTNKQEEEKERKRHIEDSSSSGEDESEESPQKQRKHSRISGKIQDDHFPSGAKPKDLNVTAPITSANQISMMQDEPELRQKRQPETLESKRRITERDLVRAE